MKESIRPHPAESHPAESQGPNRDSRWEALFDICHFYDGVLITDEEGVIRFYHRRFGDTTDLPREAILGRSILDIFPVSEKSSTIMEVLRTGIPLIDCQEEVTLSNGQRTGCIFSTIPIKSGNQTLGAIEVFNYACNQSLRGVIHLPLTKPDVVDGAHTVDRLLSRSPAMNRVKERIAIVAPTDLPVLVYGETGTGKDLVARAIHAHSQRKDARFISLNCAAIPATLLESILFGTEKGSFTGSEDQMGLFEAASGGTLFLDEINKMDPASQSKILRAIEGQTVRKVGGIEEIPVDVRIVAALNQDPDLCVENQTLRQDLYYRLNVLQLRLPPLRQRPEDLELLTRHFLDRCNEKMGKGITDISEDCKAFFRSYAWPGNIRELKNAIRGAYLMARGPLIGLEDFDWIRQENRLTALRPLEPIKEHETLKSRVTAFERSIICEALDQTPTLTAAADRLGISKQSLNYKLKTLKIPRQPPSPQASKA